MKTSLLFFLLCTGLFAQAQVGIGTTTPSKNAALDISSANKGLMLPRISDTTKVSNPSAGLLIYNMNSKSPAYHNGNQWRTLATTADTQSDSITYTITNAPSGFVNGTFSILAVSHGLANSGGVASFSDISFTKSLDSNSTGFAKSVAQGPGPGSSSFVIEFNFFRRGASTPYYSLKATSIRVSSFQISGNTGSLFAENISITPNIYGYKNWESGLSFAWNVSSKVVTSY